MSTAKNDVRELLDRLPDDATLEDIQHSLYVRQKIERGLAQEAAGQTLSQEDVEARVGTWTGESSGPS